MHFVNVAVTRFVDEHFPGFVECALVDAYGRRWIFREKVPVVSSENLWVDSAYPRRGVIACEVLKRWQDEDGRDLVRIDTEMPWAIEAINGETEFEVLSEQVIDQTDFPCVG